MEKANNRSPEIHSNEQDEKSGKKHRQNRKIVVLIKKKYLRVIPIKTKKQFVVPLCDFIIRVSLCDCARNCISTMTMMIANIFCILNNRSSHKMYIYVNCTNWLYLQFDSPTFAFLSVQISCFMLYEWQQNIKFFFLFNRSTRF